MEALRRPLEAISTEPNSTLSCQALPHSPSSCACPLLLKIPFAFSSCAGEIFVAPPLVKMSFAISSVRATMLIPSSAILPAPSTLTLATPLINE